MRFYYLRILLVIALLLPHLTKLYADNSNLLALSLIIEDDGLPYTELMINNQKIKLLIDTGSSAALSLESEYIPHLPGITKRAEKAKYQNISGETFKARSYIINRLDLGGMRFSNLGVEEFFNWGVTYQRSDNPSPARISYQGVIGTGFFAGKVVLFDPLHNRLLIATSEKALPEEYKPVISTTQGKFTFKRGKIILPARLEGNENLAIVDTGANVSLMRPKLLNSSVMPIEECSVKFEHGVACTRAKAGLTLAGQYLGIHRFYIYDIQGPKEDMLIGYDTIYDRQLLFDFVGHTLRIR